MLRVSIPQPIVVTEHVFTTVFDSCANPIVARLLGCSEGYPGLIHNEHGLACRHFSQQSPQRMKLIAIVKAEQMPSGKDVLQLGNEYKSIATKLMGYDDMVDMVDDVFEIEWNSFVCEQLIAANELP